MEWNGKHGNFVLYCRRRVVTLFNNLSISSRAPHIGKAVSDKFRLFESATEPKKETISQLIPFTLSWNDRSHLYFFVVNEKKKKGWWRAQGALW